MLIATITANRIEVALQAAIAAAHADLLELRLDLMPKALGGLEDLLRRMPAPVVATCRREGDGGEFAGSEEERGALLRRAAASGAAWIDVEWGSGVESLAEKPGAARVILSHHDWQGMPADLAGLDRQLSCRAGVSMVKLVGRARTLEDNLKVRDLLAARGDESVPLAAFCSGPAGTASRLLNLSWGSAATYGFAAGGPAAPGQISLQEMDELFCVRRIGPGTGLLGVTGHPLGHSLSPRIHNAALRHLDLDLVYLPLESAELSPLLSLAESLPLRGYSVTLPHKESILPHLDRLDPLARRIGAVNTVVRGETGWCGFNTDAPGGLEPLARRVELRGCPVALLGAGGAARALVHGLVEAGADVTVFNRDEERGRALARQAGAAAGPLRDLETHPYRVLVHATPVGMTPEEGDLPLPATWLRGEMVYDIVYRPEETALLKEARRRGIATLGGMEMFLAQAAAQFRHFTGREAPVEAMRAAAAGREHG
jgi:3-dehydroquinate dehydratase/shikimate dehydrogenase